MKYFILSRHSERSAQRTKMTTTTTTHKISESSKIIEKKIVLFVLNRTHKHTTFLMWTRSIRTVRYECRTLCYTLLRISLMPSVSIFAGVVCLASRERLLNISYFIIIIYFEQLLMGCGETYAQLGCKNVSFLLFSLAGMRQTVHATRSFRPRQRTRF